MYQVLFDSNNLPIFAETRGLRGAWHDTSVRSLYDLHMTFAREATVAQLSFGWLNQPSKLIFP